MVDLDRCFKDLRPFHDPGGLGCLELAFDVFL